MPHPGVEGVGLGHRLVAADRREGVDLEVALLEPSQRRLHLRSGGGRAGTHGGRDVDGGLLGLGHVHPVRAMARSDRGPTTFSATGAGRAIPQRVPVSGDLIPPWIRPWLALVCASGAGLGGAGRVLRLVWPVERRRRRTLRQMRSLAALASYAEKSEPPWQALPQTRLPVFVRPMPESERRRSQQRSDLPDRRIGPRGGSWLPESQHPTTETTFRRSKGAVVGVATRLTRRGHRPGAWFVLRRGPADPRRRTPSINGASCRLPWRPASRRRRLRPARSAAPSQVVAGTGQPRTARGRIGFERCSRTRTTVECQALRRRSLLGSDPVLPFVSPLFHSRPGRCGAGRARVRCPCRPVRSIGP